MLIYPEISSTSFITALIYINVLLFFLVALVYSSAGFGGGSLYLAVLSGTSLPHESIAVIGLLCNLVVTAVSSIRFAIKKETEWRRMAVLIALSLPFSFWSGGWKISSGVFFITLAGCLALAALIMLTRMEKAEVKYRTPLWLYPVVPLIGILSGMTGIGGGIYLAPLLYLSGWSGPRSIAATTALFIALNSVSGLLARRDAVMSIVQLDTEWLWLPVAVFIGGLAGSKLSVSLLEPVWIKRITAGILIFAAVRIIIRVL